MYYKSHLRVSHEGTTRRWETRSLCDERALYLPPPLFTASRHASRLPVSTSRAAPGNGAETAAGHIWGGRWAAPYPGPRAEQRHTRLADGRCAAMDPDRGSTGDQQRHTRLADGRCAGPLRRKEERAMHRFRHDALSVETRRSVERLTALESAPARLCSTTPPVCNERPADSEGARGACVAIPPSCGVPPKTRLDFLTSDHCTSGLRPSRSGW